MPFGGPGGDLQPQAMLQVFLNHTVFGMSVQEAVEAPRFVTHSFPGSFEPHPYHPGRLDLERGIGDIAGSDARGLRPPSRVAPRSLHRDGRRLRDRGRPRARRALRRSRPAPSRPRHGLVNRAAAPPEFRQGRLARIIQERAIRCRAGAAARAGGWVLRALPAPRDDDTAAKEWERLSG